MPAASAPRLVDQAGGTWRWQFTWRNPPAAGQPAGSGTPVNLTGYTGRFQVRDSPSGDLHVQLDSGALGGVVMGGSAGTITITVGDATLRAIPSPRDYVWELEVIEPSGAPLKLANGVIRVLPEILA